jgi:hypothetical protein
MFWVFSTIFGIIFFFPIDKYNFCKFLEVFSQALNIIFAFAVSKYICMIFYGTFRNLEVFSTV